MESALLWAILSSSFTNIKKFSHSFFLHLLITRNLRISFCTICRSYLSAAPLGLNVVNVFLAQYRNLESLPMLRYYWKQIVSPWRSLGQLASRFANFWIKMKAPTVSKFFCVFDLNLGGLMLGCLGAISNGTFAAILLLNLVFNAARLKHKVFGIAKEFEDISPGAKLVDELIHPTALDEEHISTSGKVRLILLKKCIEKYFLVFVFLALIIVGILSVFSFISIWFIRGVKEVNLISTLVDFILKVSFREIQRSCNLSSCLQR